MIRRFGEPKQRARRYQYRAGAYAILPIGHQILLTHQDDTDEPFQLPGGGIDPGESPIRALHREVLEETGWRIADARFFGRFRRFVYMPEYEMWAEKACSVYVARPIRAISGPTEQGHIPIFMDIRAACSKLGNPGDRAILTRASATILKQYS